MRGITHAVLGGAAGVGVAALAGADPGNWAAAYVLGGLVALVPNVDHVAPALIRRGGKLAPIGRALRGESGLERGITHSLWLLLVVGLFLILSVGVLSWIEPWIAWAALGALWSHILGDMGTLFGVRLLAPYGEAVVVPPPSNMRLVRGGTGEVLLLLATGFVGIAVLMNWAVPRLVQVFETL